MKKYIVLLLIIFFTPIFVLGDSAGPSILGYDAVVINKNGAKVEGSNDIIPYNTKVHVFDEDDYDNKKIASVCYINESNCNRWTRYILLSDIIPIKEEIRPDDLKKRFDSDGYSSSDEVYFISSNEKFIVFEKDGVKLSKGPSDIYGQYDVNIDYKTYLNTEYVLLSGGGERSTNKWYYVNDGKNKGWLNVSSYGLYAIGEHLDRILVVNDISIYDDDRNFVLTIQGETFLDNAYYIDKQDRYYIQYENKEGFIKTFNYGQYLNDGFILTIKDTKITSINSEERGSIPIGKKIKGIYGDYFKFGRDDDDLAICGLKDQNNKKYYYVEYGNIKGYILEENVFPFDYHSEEYEKEISKNIKKASMTFNDDVKIHEYTAESIYFNKPENNKVIKTIPRGTAIISLYSYIEQNYNNETGIYSENIVYLINDNGVPGWIIVKSNADVNIDINENIIKNCFI